MKLVSILGLLFAVGCTAALPKYKLGVLEKLHDEQPRAAWQYPSASRIAAVDSRSGLTGLAKPEPIPSYLPDVEPPLVIAMHVLPDGAPAIVSPLALEYESARFVFGNYTRETPTEVSVTVFEPDNGRARWTTRLRARGVFELTDVGGVLLVQSRYFDTDGVLAETRLFALRPEDGKVAWTRESKQPYRYLRFVPGGLILLSPAVEAGETRDVEALAADTGEVRWHFRVRQAADDELAQPIVIGERVLLFDRGVEVRRVADGEIVWQRENVRPRGHGQPQVAGDLLWLESSGGLVALELSTGRQRWSRVEVARVARIMPAAGHLYVVHTEEGTFSDSLVLSQLGGSTGRTKWSHETEPLLGNVVESRGRVFYTTGEELIALDGATGKELFDEDLPWDDEFSEHALTLHGSKLVVRNEWNVAAWSHDGETIYHHAFEPLSPIITTKERMLEAREQGAAVTGGVNVGGHTYAAASTVAFHESRYRQAMSAYRSTGDSSQLSSAQMHLQSAHAAGRMAASMELNMAVIGAVSTVGAAALNAKIATAHGLVYPAIDSVIHHIRDADTRDYAVRLVGVESSGQRLSAVEIVHVPTGKSKRLLLSPYQLPYDLTTVGSHDMTATEISGYLPAAVFLGHAFSTVVDLEHERVFHYGPGLDVEQYVRYADTRFVRGKLAAYPLRLP